MALNPIPPQAYTKETLQKAYSWLLRQSPEIKEMARDQEILVSLYLKAQRNGEEALDRPSIHNFRSELKNLADMMTDLNSTDLSNQDFLSKPIATSHAGTASTQASHQPSSSSLGSVSFPSVTSGEGSHDNKSSAKMKTKLSHDSVLDFLDEKSMQYLKQTKERFNLSHESEALRLLIAAGMEKLK